MKFYKELYMSDKLILKRTQLKMQLQKGEVLVNKYIIALAKNEQNHLEFFDSVLLTQNMISKDDLFIVGIADGEGEALKIVEKITQEVYDITNSTDIRNYFIKKQREYDEMEG